LRNEENPSAEIAGGWVFWFALPWFGLVWIGLGNRLKGAL